MSRIGLSPEDTGSTAGQYGIVKNNIKKYRQQFSQQEIKRIEEMVCNSAVELSYQMEYNVTYRPLSPWEQWVYKLYDGWPTIRHHIFLSTSVCQGVKRLLQHYWTSSWR
jgi:hypothetical protein